MGAPVHTARFAPGVIGQIMDGERPARVPDAVIDALKNRERNGTITLPKKPAPREKGAAPEKEFIYVTQIVITVDEQAPTKTDKKKP